MKLHGPKDVEEFCEIKIITRVYLIGFNCNSCITMHGINNAKNN